MNSLEAKKRGATARTRKELIGKRKREDDIKLPEKVRFTFVFFMFSQIEALIPESTIYNQMVEFERKLDSTLLKKKLDAKEAIRLSPQKVLVEINPVLQTSIPRCLTEC